MPTKSAPTSAPFVKIPPPSLAKIEINEKVSFLNVNESVYVPIGEKHRLSNETETILILIEVQTGEYLEEDDIKRFEDIYKR